MTPNVFKPTFIVTYVLMYKLDTFYVVLNKHFV